MSEDEVQSRVSRDIYCGDCLNLAMGTIMFGGGF